MRTPFCEKRLFDDRSQKHYTSFIWNGEEWGKSKTEGERERVKSERQSVAEKGLRRGS